MASPAAEVPPEPDAPAESPPSASPSAGWAGRYGLITIVAAVALLADQLTKSWAVSRLLHDPDGIHVVGPLHFRLAFNSGMAFSKGEGKGAIIGAVAFVIVLGMLWFARTVHDNLSRFAIGLVIGGALGNLSDRIFREGLEGAGFLGGRVIDFLYVGWWPTFNIADSCVVIGGITLAIATLRLPDEPKPVEQSAKA